jgi:hypothetical protein
VAQPILAVLAPGAQNREDHMHRKLPLEFALAALFFGSSCCAWAKGKAEYKAKDGTRVVILPISKPGHDYESRIEFYSAQNQMLCVLDYSSEDSEHGFGVVKAAWTPDSEYFVFSLTSSGGHQPWHAPTLFFSRKESAIFDLDNYVEASGISKGDFVLRAPNTVLTEAMRGEPVPLKFHLDSLLSNGRRPSHKIGCSDGKVLRPER